MAKEQKQSVLQPVRGKVLNEYKGDKELQDFFDKVFNGPDDKHKVIVLKDSDPESDTDRCTMQLLMQIGVFDKINSQSKQSEEANEFNLRT